MNKKYKLITGFILAGGKSKRMSFNKALLKVGDKTVIERSRNLMQQVFEKVFLLTNDSESYRFLDLPMIADIYKGLGPLSGIHAGLVASNTAKNFFLSCDLPLMSEEMIRYIIEYKTARPITISSAGGKSQYLCGIYNIILIPVIEDILSSSKNFVNENGRNSSSVINLMQKTDAEIIRADVLPFHKEDIYFNMNTLDDYEFIKKKILE